MNNRARRASHAAIIASLYAVLTHMQNLLLPGSATWAIQFRCSEALCVLAFFTPAAVPGLTLGCLLFNITYSGALPLDLVVGSLATFLAAAGMRQLKKRLPKWYLLPGLLLPAVTNGILVGWELTVYIGGGFLLNAVYVAIGEAAALLTLGAVVHHIVLHRRLDRRLLS